MNYRKVFEDASAGEATEEDLVFQNNAEAFARFSENTIWQDLGKKAQSQIAAYHLEMETLGSDGGPKPSAAEFAFIQGALYATRVFLDLPEIIARDLAADYKETQDARQKQD